MKKKNSYQKKAQKKQLLDGVAAEHAKGDIKKSALETGRDILVGVIGHYMGSNGAAAFGVGMMASGGYQAVAGAMNGTEKEGFEGVKERMSAFKEEFKRKLFLDKIIKSKKKEEEKSEEGTNGMGEVQYFTYPNGKELEGAADHLNVLDRIEKQVEESAKKFEAKQSVSGGMNGEIGMMDVSEQNF
jgi:hypothetical protein